MLSLSENEKRLFYAGGVFKDYTMTFPDLDLTITNETLHQEAVTVKESIIEAQEFTLGGCIASSIEFEVSEIIDVDLNGLKFAAAIALSEGNVSIPMGVYRVDSAKRVDDKDYKKVIAYDALYDASVDVSKWYADYFADGATHTVKETREALLIHLGMSFIKQNLINDDVVLSLTADTSSEMPGNVVLRSLCVLNSGFGKMSREGLFFVAYLGEMGLFPEETLYPAEKLYPEDDFANLSDGEDGANYRETQYEEYMVKPITSLIIETGSEESEVMIGSDSSNPYIIRSNFLLYGKSSDELKRIGQPIFNLIRNIVYRPNSTTLDGLPYLETGDAYMLQKRKDIIESYIFSRNLCGIQALKDTYEARGGELRANEVSVAEQIQRLQEKASEIEETVEEISEDLLEFEEKTTVRFETTEDSIEAEVARASKAEGNLSSRISITADSITAEVSRATSAENSLSSRIVQTADSITAEVSRATAAEGNLSSRITVTANEISSKVSKGDVCSEINQSSDRITLSSNRLVVNSSNFTLDASGNATFSGSLSGATGTFNGDLSSGTTYFYGLICRQGNFSVDGSSGAVHVTNLYPYSGSYIDINAILRTVSHGGVFGGDVIPSYSGAGNLGSSSYRWSEVYASKSAINTSDRRQKRDIKPIGEEYEKLWFSLKPVSFLFNGGDRTHWGMISQDLEETMKELGLTDIDVAMFCKDEKKTLDPVTGKMKDAVDENGEPEYLYSLRYGELIALNTHMLQKAYRKMAGQEQRIKELEEKLLKSR